MAENIGVTGVITLTIGYNPNYLDGTNTLGFFTHTMGRLYICRLIFPKKINM